MSGTPGTRGQTWLLTPTRENLFINMIYNINKIFAVKAYFYSLNNNLLLINSVLMLNYAFYKSIKKDLTVSFLHNLSYANNRKT